MLCLRAAWLGSTVSSSFWHRQKAVAENVGVEVRGMILGLSLELLPEGSTCLKHLVNGKKSGKNQ